MRCHNCKKPFKDGESIVECVPVVVCSTEEQIIEMDDKGSVYRYCRKCFLDKTK